jgi:hypothetical protein
MVDSVRANELLLRVQHRHGDRWVRLEPSPEHDAAEGDPERGWQFGRLFSCPECDEHVKVDLDHDERTVR